MVGWSHSRPLGAFLNAPNDQVSAAWPLGALLDSRHSFGHLMLSRLLGDYSASHCPSGCSAPSWPLIDILVTKCPLGHSASSRLPRISWWQCGAEAGAETSRAGTLCPEVPRFLIGARSGVGAGALQKFPESKYLKTKPGPPELGHCPWNWNRVRSQCLGNVVP